MQSQGFTLMTRDEFLRKAMFFCEIIPVRFPSSPHPNVIKRMEQRGYILKSKFMVDLENRESEALVLNQLDLKI